jgi:hypothetical protein
MALDFTPDQLASLRDTLSLPAGTELTEETLIRRCAMLRAVADAAGVAEVLGDVDAVLTDAERRWLGPPPE